MFEELVTIRGKKNPGADARTYWFVWCDKCKSTIGNDELTVEALQEIKLKHQTLHKEETPE